MKNTRQPFQGFSPPFHYLFSRRVRANCRALRVLRQNLFNRIHPEDYP
ncbi:MAG: hypothetical protein M9963_11855 [Kiritimatiellae bacterium]|nr:hypothetical protein [Kiritimatiellia bacterium]